METIRLNFNDRYARIAFARTLLALVVLVATSIQTQRASACVANGGYSNPPAHRPYVGESCVYYDNRKQGLITSGPYRQLIISDELLDGFAAIRGGTPEHAVTQWMTLAALGNDAANYNVGVMLHRGLGVKPDWIAALDFLNLEKQTTHYNTSNSYRIRMLQQSLIGLGFFSGKIDGEYGPLTSAAVDRALASITKEGNYSQRIQVELRQRKARNDWYYYAIVSAFQEKVGWRADPQNPPAESSSAVISLPQTARPFIATDVPADPVRIVIPAQLSGARRLSAPELYAARSASVHMIFAANRLNQSQKITDVSQGSAVAITPNTLVTNCHVIEKKNFIVLIAGGVPYPARRVGGSDLKDTCFLHSAQFVLIPILGTRRSADLNIGETVYAIGSPRRQENTLSQGLISGKRRDDGVSLLQTTAPISPGSSGGGLFDEFGNLVGITTMGIRDSQALNFAIAIEEFTR